MHIEGVMGCYWNIMQAFDELLIPSLAAAVAIGSVCGGYCFTVSLSPDLEEEWDSSE
jgi:hypothetical protein